MTYFQRLIPIVLVQEGVNERNPTGYANDPNDPGGETKWGLSQRAWAGMSGRYPTYPKATKDITRDQALTIYEQEYYLPVFEEVPVSSALILLDCQVNQGRAIKILQRAIGVTDDGVWGPNSELALGRALRDEPTLRNEILWQRMADYVSLSNYHTYATTWTRRVLAIRKEAAFLR